MVAMLLDALASEVAKRLYWRFLSDRLAVGLMIFENGDGGSWVK